MTQDRDLQFLDADELRSAFDRSFSEAHEAADDAQHRRLLALGVAGDPYAVRLSEVSALFKDRPIARLPKAIPELLGIAGVRGTHVPVFDLATLLGYRTAGPRRWLITAAGPVAAAFAFETFAGQLSVREHGVTKADTSASRQRFVREVVTADGPARPIVHIPSLVADIQARVGGGARRRSES